ncbi:Snf7-domain-containing protein [Ganoderma leucocontextum]|nr:Snf7-domain-containing protein [Ganoderma leucocontextum]
MSSVPSSQPALPTYASITTSRLKSLYSDFTYQKHSNPTSYASNVEWWRHTLEAAQLQGWLSESHNPTHTSASSDRLVLHAYGVAFADKFRVEGVGKPLSIPTVIFELCDSKTLIPLSEFLGASRSIYDPGWFPYRIASAVVGKPLWWALGQLGVVDNHGAAFGDSGSTERWKKIRGDYVSVGLLEGAAERILERQRQNSSGHVADQLFNVESFRTEFVSVAFEDAPLSGLDLKVVLKFLERDKGAIVVRGETIKFVDEGTAQMSEVTTVDTGILALKTSVEKLQAQIDNIQHRIDHTTRQISDALRQKRKEIAMTRLRARKQLEEVLKKRLSSLELLHSTLLRVETSAGDIEIMKSYESSTATLRAILAHPLLQREKIDETMDALAAANADAQEVDDAIQIGAGMAQAETGVDDSELEAELAALVSEVETEKAQAQRASLEAEELTTPAHPPASKEHAEEFAMKPDREKVLVAA